MKLEVYEQGGWRGIAPTFLLKMLRFLITPHFLAENVVFLTLQPPSYKDAPTPLKA